MRRRDFVLMLTSGAASCPFGVRAEQARHIGVLMLYPEKDPQG
jgi:hypothetical protein